MARLVHSREEDLRGMCPHCGGGDPRVIGDTPIEGIHVVRCESCHGYSYYNNITCEINQNVPQSVINVYEAYRSYYGNSAQASSRIDNVNAKIASRQRLSRYKENEYNDNKEPNPVPIAVSAPPRAGPRRVILKRQNMVAHGTGFVRTDEGRLVPTAPVPREKWTRAAKPVNTVTPAMKTDAVTKVKRNASGPVAAHQWVEYRVDDDTVVRMLQMTTSVSSGAGAPEKDMGTEEDTNVNGDY